MVNAHPLGLAFFGMGVTATSTAADLDDLAFHFGPHVTEGVRPDFEVEFSPGPGNSRECAVRRGRLTVLRRTFHGWGNIPAPVPPFALLESRICVLPAVVLARGRSVVALIGSPLSAKGSLAVALAHRSWQFVSGQLLVMERASRDVLPYHAPVEFRGDAASALRAAGLAPGTWRSTTSPINGDVLMVRPESLGAIVPIGARRTRPHLIRLCRSRDDRVHLLRRAFEPRVWPTSAAADLADASSYVLELPAASAAEEAAGILDERFHPEGDAACRDAIRTAPEVRVGSTAVRLT